MRNRFDEQLAQLNHEMIEMGALCEEVIALASKALTESDRTLAKKVAPVDSEIDRKSGTLRAFVCGCCSSSSPWPGTCGRSPPL